MKPGVSVVIAVLVCAPATAAGQTPSAPSAATEIYHVHLTKAAPGQAAALGKELSQPDATSPMPDHFVVLRHQEGDDWDYAVIQHLGQKPTVTITPPPANAAADFRAWHSDTFVSGPAWADFSREMGLGASGKPGAIYVLGFHRAAPGHRTQLEQALNQPGTDAKIQSGTVFLRHVEGGDWQYLTITRYNSWQDFAADRASAAAAGAAAAGGWADIREHSAFHRDTIADRVHPIK